MALAAIFSQAQSSLANHRKNCVNLYKIHVQAAGEVTHSSKATVKLVGEDEFACSFLDMLSRALVVKKGVASADRIVKFVGAYVKFINEKVRMEKADGSISAGKRTAQAPPEDDEDEDTFVARFVTRLLKWIMHGFLAKDKNVRYRSLFLVSEMVLWLGELDMDLYEELRKNLIQRLCDKETAIRVQCVVALARLSATEDPSELEQGEKSILELLTQVLLYDSEKEVRRIALLNIPLTRTTIDVLLSCSRDVDLLTRKLLYSTVLFSKLDNPRSLTLVQREKVIKDGLGDREGTVRASASKLIMKWFNILLDDVHNDRIETWQGDDEGVMKAMVRFLELFDVVGGEQIALDALNAIFVLKPEYLEVFTFSDEYWTELTPESALLAHAFVTNSRGTGYAEEAGLPVVTAFAFHIQSLYNKLIDKLNIAEAAEEVESEDEVTESLEDLHKVASILSSILSITAVLDYGDEIGRRKTFSVIKDMLTHPTLPLDLIDPCMEVMRAMLPSEREFIRVMVEIVVDLRDEDEEENDDVEISASFSDASQSTLRRERSFKRLKNREEMSKEDREAADLIDVRCLMLCNAVLERVNGSFEDNSTLQGILDDLIIPSVQRRESILREKALTGLGLCSLIAKKMALGSFQLFSNECLRAPDPIRVVILRVIFDLILMYETEFFGKSEEMDSKLIAFLLSIMETELGKNEPSPEILSVLSIGFSKFLLLGVVDDPKMLLCLLVAYVSPDTIDNQEVRQCLSFFFARYSTAHPRNKTRLQSIFISAFDTIMRMNESLDDDQTMIAPEKMGEMLLAWTDPQWGLEAEHLDSVKDTHANVVINILLELYSSERSENELKLLCHLLNQPMYWPKDLDSKTIHMIDLLLNNHEKQCPFEVAATTKLFERFRIRFKKLYSGRLEEIDARRYVHDDEVVKLYEAINVDVPESEGEMGSWSPLKREMSKVEKTRNRSRTVRSKELGDGVVKDEDDGDDAPVIDEAEAEDGDGDQSDREGRTAGVSDEDEEVDGRYEIVSRRASAPMSTVSTPISQSPKKKGTKRLRNDSGALTPTNGRRRNRPRMSLASKLESDDEGNESPSPVKKPNTAVARATPKSDKAVRQRNLRAKEVEKGTRGAQESEKTTKGTKMKKGEAATRRSSATLPLRSTRTTAIPKTNANKSAKPVKREKRKPPTPSPPPSDEDGAGENDEEEEEEIGGRGSPDFVEDPSDDPVTTDSEP